MVTDHEKDQLFNAVKYNNIDIVRQFLAEHGADVVRIKKEDSWTLLHTACWFGHAAIVRLLLEHGADVNARTGSDNTPFYWACWHGRTNIARLLLEYGADPNARDMSGNIPLHWACRFGHAEIVRFLVEQGTDVNARNQKGCTPLHQACKKTNTIIARLLLKHGADPGAKDKDGCTPITWIVNNLHHWPEGQKLLELIEKKHPEDYFSSFCTMDLNSGVLNAP